MTKILNALLALFLVLCAAPAVSQPYPSKLMTRGYSPEGSTPERLLEINRDDLALWRRLVREASIPLE